MQGPSSLSKEGPIRQMPQEGYEEGLSLRETETLAKSITLSGTKIKNRKSLKLNEEQ